MKQKPSRPLITYKVKAYNITHHLETVDAALEVMTRELKSATDPDASIASSLGLSIKRFQSLRMPVKQSVSLINRVRINNAEYGLIALYSAFGEYSKNLLKEFYKTNPLLVVGKASGTLQYHEIVKLGDYTMIADYMVEQVFKKLEGVRNTSKQLTSTIDGTGVILSETLLHKALMYFEIRHLLVHRSRRIDQSFIDRFAIDVGCSIKRNGKLPITVGFAMKGIRAVNSLIEDLDQQLISKGFLTPASV